ncbi:MAG: AAA domain-containing protein [Clostridia bacterium]
MDKKIILIEYKNQAIRNETDHIEKYEFDGHMYHVQYKGTAMYYHFNISNFYECSITNIRTLEPNEIIVYDGKYYEPAQILFLCDILNRKKILFVHKNIDIITDFSLISICAPQKKIEDISHTVLRRKDGFVYTHVKEVYIYSHFYKIYFENNSSIIVSKSQVEISSLIEHLDVFDYFKEITKILISDNDDITRFLNRQYEKMPIDSNSFFYNFLKEPCVVEKPLSCNLIFPFDFNKSQIDATKKALSHNVSVIEGPPGTGKTQTILNILMNLFMQGMSVAVVSGNNYAVQNIQAKLKEYHLDFLTALLGKTDNRNTFFEETHSIPDLSKYHLNMEEKQHLQSSISSAVSQIEELLELNNILATKQLELSTLEDEFIYFQDNLKQEKITTFMSFSNLSLQQLSNLIVETYIIPQNKKISFFNKLKLFFKYRYIYFKELEEEPDKVQLNLQRYLYEKRKLLLNQEINELKTKLIQNNFDNLSQQIRENSMKLLQATLYEHYNQETSNTFNNDYNSPHYYLKHFPQFIQKHPIVLSTVHALKSCSLQNFLYDYVIIDESSQTDLVAAGVALSCARNIIVVGDLKQLSHIVRENIKEEINHLTLSYHISPPYDYVKNNILSCIKLLYKNVPHTLLREHYRCHPKIINFCNQFFYDNELIIHTKGSTEDTPLLLISSSGGHTSREDENQKLFNLREIEECLHYKPEINKENYPLDAIGFIAPFNSQVNLAEEYLEKDIFKSTINKFQGQESKIIIFSTVLDDSSRNTYRRLQFVNDARLVNVAVSRAKKRFVLISNNRAFKPGSTIAELTNYMQYNSLNNAVIESDVYSIFDLMYKTYSPKLEKICVENIQKISRYPSENLANFVISEVLNLPEYHFLDYVFSLNLKKLIRNPNLLTEEEKHFVYQTNSEVDFVIYNKNSHMPVLLIEVDAFAFHHKEKDRKRDAMKNHILNKYGIHYIRWATHGSGEKQTLINTLNEIMSQPSFINTSHLEDLISKI